MIKNLFRLLVLIRNLWGHMLVAIVFGTMGHFAAILIPVMGISLLVYPDYAKISLVILIGSGLLRGVFRYIEQAFNHELAFRVLADIRDKVFGKLRVLAPAKLETQDRGNLIAMITGDIERLEVFFAHTLSPIFIALIVKGLITYYMFSVHLYLGLVSIVSYIFMGIAIPIIGTIRTEKAGYQYRHDLGNLNSFVLNGVMGVFEILQFNKQKSILSSLKNQSDSLASNQSEMNQGEIITQAMSEVVVVVSILVVGYLGYRLDLAYSDYLIAFVLFASSFGPVIALSSLSVNMAHILASAKRILDLLDEPPVVNAVVSTTKPHFENITLDKVSFGYGTVNILEDFNLNVQKNETWAIQGESGVGKSTLLRLIMRFWDPDTDVIRLSDVDLREIDSQYLRSQQGLMSQSTEIFNLSIKDNICLGKDDQDLVLACEKAGIHDFIMTLPNQYETILGSFGNSISTGEKQRIGLARLFFHNQDLWILDELTSNLDSLNEALILNSLKNERGKRTILITSHRTSVETVSDHILKMD